MATLDDKVNFSNSSPVQNWITFSVVYKRANFEIVCEFAGVLRDSRWSANWSSSIFILDYLYILVCNCCVCYNNTILPMESSFNTLLLM